MFALILLLVYGLGFAGGFIAAGFLHWPPPLPVFTGLALGGVLAVFTGLIYWVFMVPPISKRLAKAKAWGLVLFLIGSDRRVRVVPAESDGFVIKPGDRELAQRYEFLADSTAAYQLDGSGGVTAYFATIDYAFPIDPWYAAAANALREMGYPDLEAVKIAREIPDPARLEELLSEALRRAGELEEKARREGLTEEEEELLAQLRRRIETYKRLIPLARQYAGRGGVEAGGRIVDFDDFIHYVCFQHNPERVKRRVHAEANALMARMASWRSEVLKWGGLIVLAAIAVIGLVAAIHMFTGASLPNPAATVAHHVANATATAPHPTPTPPASPAPTPAPTQTPTQTVTTITTVIPHGG